MSSLQTAAVFLRRAPCVAVVTPWPSLARAKDHWHGAFCWVNLRMVSLIPKQADTAINTAIPQVAQRRTSPANP